MMITLDFDSNLITISMLFECCFIIVITRGILYLNVTLFKHINCHLEWCGLYSTCGLSFNMSTMAQQRRWHSTLQSTSARLRHSMTLTGVVGVHIWLYILHRLRRRGLTSWCLLHPVNTSSDVTYTVKDVNCWTLLYMHGLSFCLFFTTNDKLTIFLFRHCAFSSQNKHLMHFVWRQSFC